MATIKLLWQKATVGCFFNTACQGYSYTRVLLEKFPDKKAAIAMIKDSSRPPWEFPWKRVETLEEADLVYYDGGHWAVHVGDGIIESVWGSFIVLFRHKLFQVPNTYGNKVSFSKLDIEALLKDPNAGKRKKT